MSDLGRERDFALTEPGSLDLHTPSEDLGSRTPVESAITTEQESACAELDRVLHSDTFRNSPSLRRLLKYLADKTLRGEADQLKEYTIGVDAFGKPPTYDTRGDSIVRLQVSRLRQRLADYYQGEGGHDPLTVDLPKGHFGVSFTPRSSVSEEMPDADLAIPLVRRGLRASRLVVALAVVATIATALGAWSAIALWHTQQQLASVRRSWTPELEALWAPFLTANRPLIVSVGSPMFLALGRPTILFRDMSLNTLEAAANAPNVQNVRKALGSPEIQPSYLYTMFGETMAAFQLERLLATRELSVSLEKSIDLSWQQRADNNVVVIGSPTFLGDQLRGMLIEDEFVWEDRGLRDRHPAAGAPAFYQDEMRNAGSDGLAYALVTHTPGPLGKGDASTFVCVASAGRAGAVQWFTDPALARQLVGNMKNSTGSIPRYYQVLFKVVFKSGVPLQTSYVLHRELRTSAVK